MYVIEKLRKQIFCFVTTKEKMEQRRFQDKSVVNEGGKMRPGGVDIATASGTEDPGSKSARA
jgi:hypothetical protein